MVEGEGGREGEGVREVRGYEGGPQEASLKVRNGGAREPRWRVTSSTVFHDRRSGEKRRRGKEGEGGGGGGEGVERERESGGGEREGAR